MKDKAPSWNICSWSIAAHGATALDDAHTLAGKGECPWACAVTGPRAVASAVSRIAAVIGAIIQGVLPCAAGVIASITVAVTIASTVAGTSHGAIIGTTGGSVIVAAARVDSAPRAGSSA